MKEIKQNNVSLRLDQIDKINKITSIKNKIKEYLRRSLEPAEIQPPEFEWFDFLKIKKRKYYPG